MIKALVIVAHPDDETIWMGGTILKNKDWQWTIVSLCRKDDTDRMPKFMKACKYYNAKPIISDLDDEQLNPLSIDAIKDKIKDIISEKEYDYIYTHGKNGEYGHLRHKEIHKSVKELVNEKSLICKSLLFFSYELHGKIALPRKEKDLISLSNEEYSMKLKIITEIYGFLEDSFETLCCSSEEAFEK